MITFYKPILVGYNQGPYSYALADALLYTSYKNRAVLMILVKFLKFSTNASPILINTIYMDKCNNETVSQSVVESIASLGIKFNDVMCFNSDNVSHMVKAYKDHLKAIFPNSIHIGCA